MSAMTAEQRARLTVHERREYGILLSRFVRGVLKEKDWFRLKAIVAKSRRSKL